MNQFYNVEVISDHGGSMITAGKTIAEAHELAQRHIKATAEQGVDPSTKTTVITRCCSACQGTGQVDKQYKKPRPYWRIEKLKCPECKGINSEEVVYTGKGLAS